MIQWMLFKRNIELRHYKSELNTLYMRLLKGQFTDFTWGVRGPDFRQGLRFTLSVFHFSDPYGVTDVKSVICPFNVQRVILLWLHDFAPWGLLSREILLVVQLLVQNVSK